MLREVDSVIKVLESMMACVDCLTLDTAPLPCLVCPPLRPAFRLRPTCATSAGRSVRQARPSLWCRRWCVCWRSRAELPLVTAEHNCLLCCSAQGSLHEGHMSLVAAARHAYCWFYPVLELIFTLNLTSRPCTVSAERGPTLSSCQYTSILLRHAAGQHCGHKRHVLPQCVLRALVSMLCGQLCEVQFSQHEDFDKYPRDNEADVAQLTAAEVDAVFEPHSLYIRSGSRRLSPRCRVGGNCGQPATLQSS